MKATSVARINESVLEVMKRKLKQNTSVINNKPLLNNDTKNNNISNHRGSKRHGTSMIRNTPHSKHDIPGIYRHEKILESHNNDANESVPKSMLLQRDLISRNKSTLDPEDRKVSKTTNWKSDFAISNSYLSQTSIRAKTEFDSMIKEWISTNWLDTKPIIQQKPCHILIHDKLLFDNLSLFDVVYNYLVKSIPEVKFLTDKHTLNVIWKNEMNKLLQTRSDVVAKSKVNHSLKDVIKSVFSPILKADRNASMKLNKFIKDPFLTRKIVSSLMSNVKYNPQIFSKLKDVENLNKRNDITVIKDNELLFLQSLDYKNLLDNINTQDRSKSLERVSILEYHYRNKLNDYKNMDALEEILLTKKLHRNERFLILTGERSTSLEYFRLIKLLNKENKSHKLKGCVVYLDKTQAQKNKEIIAETKYTGKELYYVVENFSNIYDIIEVL